MRIQRGLNVLMVTIVLLLGVLSASDTVKAAEKKTVELNKKAVTLVVGRTQQLTLKNAPKNKTITWSSSNKKIATVTKRGKVTAKKRGKATITAKAGKKKYTCKVTVIKKNASDVAALKKLIKQQRKAGAKVPKDIDDSCYEWNKEGRLIGIEWNGKKLKGIISFSEFPVLETLDICNNRLTGVDVSQNENLVTLNCTYNRLTTLDVSCNKKLFDLWCGYNQLVELNVDNNVDLESLYCQNNRLTELKLGQSGKLMMDLDCSYNQLISLDVSKNTGLWRLQCSNNQLTSLDVSKNQFLKELYCDHNQITQLNLKENKSLQMLEHDDKVKVIR